MAGEFNVHRLQAAEAYVAMISVSIFTNFTAKAFQNCDKFLRFTCISCVSG